MAISGTHPTPRSDLSVQIFGEEEFVEHLGIKWFRVVLGVNWVRNENKRWVSLGSSPHRENLFFDETLIHDLKIKALNLTRGKPIIQVLQIVNEIINGLTSVQGEDYFITDSKLELALNQLVDAKRTPTQTFVNIEMNELIQRRILVCRHKGLLAAAILGFLVENQVLPEGFVRQYRATIALQGSSTAHTWSVYRENATGRIWICDPRWQVSDNVNVNFAILAQRYTKEALAFMLQRLDAEDVYFPLLENIEDQVAVLPFTIEAFQNEEPGLILCFKFHQNDKTLSTFRQALSQQSIQSFEKEYTIYVRIADNPAILTLNFDKLLKDYELLSKLLTVPHSSSFSVQPALAPVKPVLFSISTTSTFKSVDWDELKALESLPDDFVTGNGLFSRFSVKK